MGILKQLGRKPATGKAPGLEQEPIAPLSRMDEPKPAEAGPAVAVIPNPTKKPAFPAKGAKSSLLKSLGAR